MSSEPREVIAHSPFDEDTREMLLDVYENIHRRFRMDEAIANAVVNRILALAEAGERSPEIIEKAATPAGQAGA
jgi:hypothetical protein